MTNYLYNAHMGDAADDIMAAIKKLVECEDIDPRTVRQITFHFEPTGGRVFYADIVTRSLLHTTSPEAASVGPECVMPPDVAS